MKQGKVLLVWMVCMALGRVACHAQEARPAIYDIAAVIQQPLAKTAIDKNAAQKVRVSKDSLLHLLLGFRCDTISSLSDVVVMIGREKGSGEVANETISIYKEKNAYRQKGKKDGRQINKNAVSYSCQFYTRDKPRAKWVTVYCHYKDNRTSPKYYYKLN